jgi:hypothetical protein
VTTSALPTIESPKPARNPLWHPVAWIAWQIVNFIAMGFVIFFAVEKGLEVREWAWWQSYHIHFSLTLNNAIKWGRDANEHGILTIYPRIIKEDGDDLHRRPGQGRLPLDYGPLRLLIAAKWAAWADAQDRAADEKMQLDLHRQHHQPAVLTKADQLVIAHKAQDRKYTLGYWRNTYEFNEPMLELNTACEGAGAIAMFLLVHYWLRRCRGAPGKQWIDPLYCAWPALFAALLVWFSPAVIFNAHCYPQWDCYTLAPFLLAVYFGMLDLWLISGLLIGAVSLAKGQVLIVMPAVVIWQLLLMRPVQTIQQIALRLRGQSDQSIQVIVGHLLSPIGRVLRLGIGILLAIGVIASPWLVSNELSSSWVLSCGIALVWILPLFFLRRWTWPDVLGGALSLLVASVFVLWPWHAQSPLPGLERALEALLIMALAARFLPRGWIPAWVAAGFAAVLYACYPVFNTSMDWYTIGIKFPTEHWQELSRTHVFNLGAILEHSYGWEFDSVLNLQNYLPWIKQSSFDVANHYLAMIEKAPAPGEPEHYLATLPIIPIRYLMQTAYLMTMTLSAIGMAIQYRRRDRNFFFAMVAPWLLMYTLLPQMQNRYSIWAAVFAAATAAFSVDGLVLFLLLNAINFLDTALDMFYQSQNTPTSEKYMPLVMPLFPDLGWMVLLLAGIYLYLALRRDRRKPLIDLLWLETRFRLLVEWFQERSRRNQRGFEVLPPVDSQQPSPGIGELLPA